MRYGFIVEGFNDEAKLREVVPNAHFVVTKGTRMNGRVKMDLESALGVCDEVFLLTDPDEAGDILASMINKLHPTLKRVTLDRNKCLCYRGRKLKVGVEHCDRDYLRGVLESYIKIESI